MFFPDPYSLWKKERRKLQVGGNVVRLVRQHPHARVPKQILFQNCSFSSRKRTLRELKSCCFIWTILCSASCRPPAWYLSFTWSRSIKLTQLLLHIRASAIWSFTQSWHCSFNVTFIMWQLRKSWSLILSGSYNLLVLLLLPFGMIHVSLRNMS